jgi:hypothetical protein
VIKPRFVQNVPNVLHKALKPAFTQSKNGG